jgi:CRP/FNR family cyclic AMP-dependent transcriptional regulator
MTTTDVLRAVPLFQGMTDRAIEVVSQIAEETDYPEGDVIVREGDPGDTFIVIVEGEAAVSQGGTAIRELGAGAFLGEIALIDGGNRTATVTATTPIRALTIDRAGFARLIDEFPVLRLDVLTALADRVRRQEASVLA